MGKAALDELQDGGNSVNPTTQYEYGLITTMLNAYNQTRIAGGKALSQTVISSCQQMSWTVMSHMAATFAGFALLWASMTAMSVGFSAVSVCCCACYWSGN